MTRPRAVIPAALAAVAPVAAVAVDVAPAAAENDQACLNDINRYRVQYQKDMAFNGNPANGTFGWAFLYYNPHNRCVYGKASTPRNLTGVEHGVAILNKTNHDTNYVRQSRCDFYPGSNSCITEKFVDPTPPFTAHASGMVNVDYDATFEYWAQTPDY